MLEMAGCRGIWTFLTFYQLRVIQEIFWTMATSKFSAFGWIGMEKLTFYNKKKLFHFVRPHPIGLST